MLITEAATGRVVDANDAFLHMTSFARGAVTGEPLSGLPIWENGAECDEVAREVAERGGFRGRDVRLVDRERRVIDCLLSAERICRQGSECVIWLAQDITARRNSELELADVMEAVMKDASWFSRTVMEKLAELRDPRGVRTGKAQVDLSPRERDVLALIGEGLDDAAIAERLDLSRNTVRNRVARLYAKIGVNRRSAAVIWARERGY